MTTHADCKIVPLENDQHCAAIVLPDGRELARIVVLYRPPGTDDDEDAREWANIDVILTHQDTGTPAWPAAPAIVDTYDRSVQRRAIAFHHNPNAPIDQPRVMTAAATINATEIRF